MQLPEGVGDPASWTLHSLKEEKLSYIDEQWK